MKDRLTHAYFRIRQQTAGS